MSLFLLKIDEPEYRQFRGHIKFVYRATKKEVKSRNEKFLLTLPQLRSSTVNDPHYRDLYETWKENKFHNYYNPILTKPKFKLPYSKANFAWIHEGTVNQIKNPHEETKLTAEHQKWAEEQIQKYRKKLREKASKGK